MTNLDSILKSRDITLLTKVCLVKATVLLVVMCECESGLNKVEHWRIDAFELWCWRRLSRVPWTARSSNQSILNEIRPGCSLEGAYSPSPSVNIHWSWSSSTLVTDTKNWLTGKDPDAGQDWGQEEKGTTEDEMVGWHQSEQALEVGDGQGSLACCSPWGHKESDNWAPELNWTEQAFASQGNTCPSHSFSRWIRCPSLCFQNTLGRSLTLHSMNWAIIICLCICQLVQTADSE